MGSWGHELEPGSRAWRHGGHAMERAERAEWRRERQDYGSSLAPPPLKAGVGGYIYVCVCVCFSRGLLKQTVVIRILLGFQRVSKG